MFFPLPLPLEMLDKSPLLIRRQKVDDALLWLRNNNPLYADLDPDAVHARAAEYPENGLPLPISEFVRTTNTSEGSSYARNAADPSLAAVSTAGMPASTVEDADSVDRTFARRKLGALETLKKKAMKDLKEQNSTFVKFPSGATPCHTKNHPETFALLFPTLFPYGVGSFENTRVWLDQSAPFRNVHLRTHVQHLLTSGPEARFQTHMSFVFVLNNILQRRQSAFDAKLAVRRDWFPKVNELFQQVDPQTIASYSDKLRKNPFAKPEMPGEEAAAKLCSHVSYVAQHVPGSTAEIQRMCQEMFSIVNCEGLPHVFFTLNPADVCNPVAQVLAGRDIDLNKIFDDLAPGAERTIRATTMAENPVASAKFFHLSVKCLLDILFGTRRENGIGVFGKVGAYYGVVEAQGRGSLHVHILVWLEHQISPPELQRRIQSDPQVAQSIYDWFDDVFSLSFPEGTQPYVPQKGDYSRLPVLCRPPDPDDPDFGASFAQNLRDLLHEVDQIHTHSETCFKYLPKTLRIPENMELDCRFNLPRNTVEKTHLDDEGTLHLKCADGRVVPHNPLCTIAERCNTDCKPIGSGGVAMSMCYYVGNYTIKGAMDTAFIFSALCAAIKILNSDPPKGEDGDVDAAERSRLLLVKSVNQLIGKKELSGQQVVSRIMGWPSKYTNREYPVYYWSRMLRECARGVFDAPTRTSDGADPASATSNDVAVPGAANDVDVRLDSADPSVDPRSVLADVFADSESDPAQPSVVLTPALLASSEDVDPDDEQSNSMLFNDIFYRPPQLADLCAWEIMVGYRKHELPKSATQTKQCLRFSLSHPQYTTHCLKKLSSSDAPRVPVFVGYPIPRNDCEADEERYFVVALALFGVWSSNVQCPLKAEDQSWADAYSSLRVCLSPAHVRILENMQLLYASRDAKEDYAALRQKRIAEIKRQAALLGQYSPDDDDDGNTYDPEWDLGMQTEVTPDSPAEMDDPSSNLNADNSLAFAALESAGFYQASAPSTGEPLPCRAHLAGNEDAKHDEQGEIPDPLLSSLGNELDAVKSRHERQAGADAWKALHPWQKVAMALVEKHMLNEKQTLAFLILADNVGRQLDTDDLLEPVRELVTGPGGTGKSQIFKAWKEFHSALDILAQLRLTGPTGVVASDIGGSTTHSEVSLCVARTAMNASDRKGEKLRKSLEERLAPVRTMVVDEIYFLGAKEASLLSEYLSVAKGITVHPFGNLNIIACGDPCQLPPPGGKSLFDRELVGCYKSNNLNAGNDSTQYNIKGIEAFHQLNRVVVLTEIMRQRGDPILINILSRLRTGVCTQSDKDLLDHYVLSDPTCSQETRDLTDIRHWLDGQGCPLVTYTNEARDAHNLAMAKAFAEATGQEMALYYSSDTRGAGNAKKELRGVAAESAWRVPVKEADDLGGKVPYIPGIPVFCTDNLATELGLSKGSMGKLFSIKYVERNGRRYAVSAEVDFPGYQSEDPEHPHRVLLKCSTSSIKFTLPNGATKYSATRHQLPIIPAFAFMSHNSQGHSLERAVIDLASCRSIQSAYVMLSRLRSLKGLCILRPFRLSVIKNHISQELRQELERTERLAKETLYWARSQLAWYYTTMPSMVFDELGTDMEVDK
uniref:ATP-dependent DNA helicase n=1 Tax=Mycena chlorophos TaxID=658473 RepID=A0ABQ0L8M2_MYCCL|nr:ATP-dependent DNA helicase [Mycena chlorophos]